MMSTIYLNKIREWFKKNQADIAIVVGFILVALIAFGAGRLSSPPVVRNPLVIDEQNASSTFNLYGNVSQPLGQKIGEYALPVDAKGLFVASRGGTKYHWPWCSYAKNIKPGNEIWFNSEAEAQQAGYSPCGCIQSKAPAGYKK